MPVQTHPRSPSVIIAGIHKKGKSDILYSRQLVISFLSESRIRHVRTDPPPTIASATALTTPSIADDPLETAVSDPKKKIRYGRG